MRYGRALVAICGQGLRITGGRVMAETAATAGQARSAQLDGLRGITILGVVYNHAGSTTQPFADVDVGLFYLLSSFLISRQMLALGDSGWTFRAFFNFHARRALRIWPVYFAAVAVVLLFNMDDARNTALWHLLFASNILFMLTDSYQPWPAAAWWSLAMQEQFYIAISLLFLLAARRHLAKVLAAAFVAGPIFLAARSFAPPDLARYDWALLLPAWSSFYATGSLLALAAAGGWQPARWHWWAALALAGTELLPDLPAAVMAVIRPLYLAVLVYGAHAGFTGLAGKTLACPAVTLLGRVSLGIFLYHIPVWWFVTELDRSGRAYQPGPVLFVVVVIATVAVSLASWFFLERRILALKRHFPFP